MDRKDALYDEMLHEYVQGRLGADEALELERKMKNSPELHARLHSIKAYYSALEQEPAVVSEDFLQKVHEKIQKNTPAGVFFKRLFFPLHIKLPIELAGLAGAAVLIFIVLNPITIPQKSTRETVLAAREEGVAEKRGAAAPAPESIGEKTPTGRTPPDELPTGKTGKDNESQPAPRSIPMAFETRTAARLAGDGGLREIKKPGTAAKKQFAPGVQSAPVAPAIAEARPFEESAEQKKHEAVTTAAVPTPDLSDAPVASAMSGGISHDDYSTQDSRLKEQKSQEENDLPLYNGILRLTVRASAPPTSPAVKSPAAAGETEKASLKAAASDREASQSLTGTAILETIKESVRNHGGVLVLASENASRHEYMLTVPKDRYTSLKKELERLGHFTATKNLQSLYSYYKLKLIVSINN
jgi:anti-sigma factor RsiW